VTENLALEAVLEAKRRKAKEKQNELFKKRMTIILFILIFISLLNLYIFTPISNIKEINVKGNTYLSNEEIINLSSYQIGDKFFLTFTSTIKNDIQKSPYISEVEVKHKLYNQLEIKVVERKLVGYSYTSDGVLAYTADASRIVLDENHLSLISNIPMFIDFKDFTTLANDNSVVVKINDNNLDLLANIPLFIGYQKNQVIKLAEGLKNIDSSVLDSLSEIHPYETSYDNNMYHLVTREAKHVFLEYESIDKLNNLLTIETHLSSQDKCLFFVSNLNSAYSKVCPWDEVVEESENADEVIDEDNDVSTSD